MQQRKNLSNLNTHFVPAYVNLYTTGELKTRADILWQMMEKCCLCPRMCGVNRHKGEVGVCGAKGTKLVISSYHPHFGEEKVLVGNGGSGTIFFAHCSLRCVFCQNWQISHLGSGTECEIEDLSNMMLELQQIGCHNINLVTPTHYSAHIVKALHIAVSKGLRLPVVWNTSGWERTEILNLLDGIVDIYLADFKYWDKDMAKKYSSGAESYPEITQQAILEMQRQVGVAKPATDGVVYRGLMIRILVMPSEVSGSQKVISWVAKNLPKDTYVNIMSQYHPQYKAYNYPEISRRITKEEYNNVVQKAKTLGLTNLDIQGWWWI